MITNRLCEAVAIATTKQSIPIVILSVAKNPKNQSKIFGYFAYAQYDNEKIKRNGLPRLAFASLAMTNQPISSLRGDLSPKQTKNNKHKKE